MSSETIGILAMGIIVMLTGFMIMGAGQDDGGARRTVKSMYGFMGFGLGFVLLLVGITQLFL